ncbi:MAG: SAM-dependent methyltransferase [Myxococcales bacterium]|nr:SAM-dependent methyltransferase [Myxococcales bacterium]
MRPGFPSVTATLVAFARGAASSPGMGSPPFHDDHARALLPFPVGALVPRVGALGARVAQGFLRAASLGLVDHLAMRSHAIDAEIAEAIDAGAEQLVLLGAGLDARAHRLHAVRDVRVFEVDHPASQAYKRSRAAGLPVNARDLVYVPQDFATDTLEAALGGAGHDRARVTAWVCEGVTMYLAPAETRALLAAVRDLSAPGSRLALTYMESDKHPLPRPLRGLVDLPLRAFGEPFRGTWSRPEVAALAAREGFRALSDTSSLEWARRFEGRSAALLRSERLLVAERA